MVGDGDAAAVGDAAAGVGQAGRYGIAEAEVGQGAGTAIAQDDGVAQGIADIDGVGTVGVGAPGHGLFGVERAGQRRLAAHRQVGRLGAVAWVAVAVGRRRYGLIGIDQTLVADDGAVGDAVIDRYLEGDRRRRTDRQGTDINRQDAVADAAGFQAIECAAISDIGRIRREGIGEDDVGRRNTASISQHDAVFERVAAVGDIKRCRFIDDRHGLGGREARRLGGRDLGCVAILVGAFVVIGSRAGAVVELRAVLQCLTECRIAIDEDIEGDPCLIVGTGERGNLEAKCLAAHRYRVAGTVGDIGQARWQGVGYLQIVGIRAALGGVIDQERKGRVLTRRHLGAIDALGDLQSWLDQGQFQGLDAFGFSVGVIVECLGSLRPGVAERGVVVEDGIDDVVLDIFNDDLDVDRDEVIIELAVGGIEDIA